MKRSILIASDLHNVGDLTLLLQCAHGLRNIGWDGDFWVRTWAEPPVAAMRQLRSADIRVLRAKRLELARSRGARLVYAGGQAVRRNVSLYNTLQDLVLAAWVRMSGGRADMLACGVEEVGTGLKRLRWRLILQHLSTVTVRDRHSRAAVLNITNGVVAPPITADLAFLPSPLHERLRRSVEKDTLVISPCVEASEQRGFDDSRLLQRLSVLRRDRSLKRVCVIAHDPRAHVDGDVTQALCRKLKAAEPQLEISCVVTGDLDDYDREYARASLVVTNRLHAAIFAMLADADVLILDDGLTKLRELASRFHLAATPAYEPASGEALSQLVRVKQKLKVQRDAALAEAKTGAGTNFELLVRT